jgi:hypothetical protein
MNFVHIRDTHIRVTPMEPIAGFPLETQIDSDGGKLREALRKAYFTRRPPGPRSVWT